MITTVAVIPSSPLTLPGHPGRPHPMVGDLRPQIDRALTTVQTCDRVIVLAGSPAGAPVTVATGEVLGLAGYGRPAPPSDDLSPAAVEGADVRRLVATARILSRTRASGRRGRQDVTVNWPDQAVLAAHVARLAPGLPILGVQVPVDLHTTEVGQIADAVTGIADTGRTALVVSGDLSAGHGPKPPRPGVDVSFDELVVAALDNGEPSRLLRLDPTRAGDARGVGALRVLGAVLIGAGLGTVVRWAGAPLGVGYVVAVGG